MTSPTIFRCSEPLAVFRNTAVVRLMAEHYPHWPSAQMALITREGNILAEHLREYQGEMQFVRLPNSDTFEAILEFSETKRGKGVGQRYSLPLHQ